MWQVDLPVGIEAPKCVICGDSAQFSDPLGDLVCKRHFTAKLHDHASNRREGRNGGKASGRRRKEWRGK